MFIILEYKSHKIIKFLKIKTQEIWKVNKPITSTLHAKVLHSCIVKIIIFSENIFPNPYSQTLLSILWLKHNLFNNWYFNITIKQIVFGHPLLLIK